VLLAVSLPVDVVVVTYNSAERLERALGGLGDVSSVVVVDNASIDASAEVAARLGAITVVNGVNAGFAAAANQGAALGQAEHVLFLNPDAAIGHADLERLVAAMRDDPRVAVAGPRLEGPDGAQRPAWPFPSAGRAWLEAFGLGGRPGPRRRSAAQFAVGACLLVRRERFADAGGFDPRFWLYGEEADLCARLVEAGWRVEVVADAVAHHEGGASAEHVEGLVFEHFQRGPEHFVAKHAGPGALWSLRVAELTGSILRSVAPSPERRAYHRRRARRLVRELSRRPGSVGLDSPATAAPGAGLVVCSLERWDEVWRRNQFLVRELLSADPGRRVLFVEPPYDVTHEWRLGSGRPRRRGLRPVPEDGRVVRFEPRKVWPRLLGPLAARSLRRQVRRAAAELGFDDPDLWINDPSWAGLVRASGWPGTYDITDDWTEADAPRRVRRRVDRWERRLLQDCGSVVVCSPGLASTRRSRRSDLRVIPNAVDVDHTRQPRPRPLDLPGTPVALYVGTLHADRIDVRLLVELADALPELSVVLVGPDALTESSRAELDARPNIRRLGVRPYGAVPGYLQHAEVLLVPHVVSGFTESLDPIKAYEYVAVGRPIVTTPVAGFRDLGGPARVATGRAFIDAVAASASPRVPTAEQPGDLPSWADRAEAFADALASARGAVVPQPLRIAVIDHCAQLSGGEIALTRLLAAVADPAEAGGVPIEPHVVLGETGPLAATLAERGIAVEVLALDRRIGSLRRDAASPWRLGLGQLGALTRDVIALRRRLVELRPAVVHTNSLKAALYGGVAGRAARVPVVWHVRDRLAADYLPRPAVAMVRALALVIPDAIVVDSEAVRATLGPVRRSGRVAVEVIPSPVGPAMPSSRPTSSDGPLRVAMVGRLAPWKGQDVFVRACAIASQAVELEALVVGSAMFGDDAFEDEVRELARRSGLDGRMTFTGFLEDVSALLPTVDVVVHASVVAEPFGLVVVEAMASGAAVVASDLGGPREIVTDGIDGLLCPPGDPDALAAHLVRLAGDAALRDRLGAAAVVAARAYDPQVVGARFAACLAGVARRRPRGGVVG
jgi:glycosyltransferase involved in cell wall biosynthesis/GT2 family glycosyltransferase